MMLYTCHACSMMSQVTIIQMAGFLTQTGAQAGQFYRVQAFSEGFCCPGFYATKQVAR